MNNWYNDLDAKSIEKASEVLPRIDLPQPEEPPIIIAVNEDPYEVDVKDGGKMFVGKVTMLSPEKREGSLIFPKSLRFNMAKALQRLDGNYKKTTIVGKTFKIWSIMDDGKKYYQGELSSQQTLK